MRALDVCRRSAELHIFPTPLYSSVEFKITGYYDLGRLRHADIQHTDLSCHTYAGKVVYISETMLDRGALTAAHGP